VFILSLYHSYAPNRTRGSPPRISKLLICQFLFKVQLLVLTAEIPSSHLVASYMLRFPIHTTRMSQFVVMYLCLSSRVILLFTRGAAFIDYSSFVYMYQYLDFEYPHVVRCFTIHCCTVIDEPKYNARSLLSSCYE